MLDLAPNSPNSLIGTELHELLGADDYLVLLEVYGGIRLFVPKDIELSQLQGLLKTEGLRRLSDCHGGNYLKIPLDRTFRARRYRGQGKSNARIARKLGITESAVERLFARVRRNDPRQIDLFS